MGKTALITGITGQDGPVLARFLLEKGYDVHGIRPYHVADDAKTLFAMAQGTRLHYADMTDMGSLMRVLSQVRPDEIYNLAAMSHVHVSFSLAEHTTNVNGLGTLRLLEAVCALNMQNQVRFYQASSSEMFGNAPSPQNEQTPFAPCSPYGASKLYAYWIVRTYREAYRLYASNGILFNHESPLRGEMFVTRKITRAVAALEGGTDAPLFIGNLEARRDWGHARDYMRGAWMMLQREKPDDYVLATGTTRSVREFIEAAFGCVGRTLRWKGTGLEEKGFDARTGALLVCVDSTLYRPNEVHELCGDSSKARSLLGWKPNIPFDDLVNEMVEADLATSSMSPIQEKLYA